MNDKSFVGLAEWRVCCCLLLAPTETRVPHPCDVLVFVATVGEQHSPARLSFSQTLETPPPPVPAVPHDYAASSTRVPLPEPSVAPSATEPTSAPPPSPPSFQTHPARRLQTMPVFREKGSAWCASAPASAADATDTRAAAADQRARCFRSQHRRLPAAIRMAAQKNPAACLAPHRRNRCAQPILILLRTSSRRWPVRPRLAERQIASQHRHARCTECLRQRSQQRRLAVGPGAVCQHQAIRDSTSRPMQKPPHPRILPRIVSEFFALSHSQCPSSPIAPMLIPCRSCLPERRKHSCLRKILCHPERRELGAPRTNVRGVSGEGSASAFRLHHLTWLSSRAKSRDLQLLRPRYHNRRVHDINRIERLIVRVD